MFSLEELNDIYEAGYVSLDAKPGHTPDNSHYAGLKAVRDAIYGTIQRPRRSLFPSARMVVAAILLGAVIGSCLLAVWTEESRWGQTGAIIGGLFAGWAMVETLRFVWINTGGEDVEYDRDRDARRR